MKPLGILGALAGGALGAVIWGVIAWKLQVEVGYVAWGIGFAVGGASAFLGGRGVPNGVLCAVVALMSIMGGKMLAVKWSVPDAMKEIAATEITQEMYDGAMLSAAAVSSVSTDDEIKKAMIDIGYTEATSEAAITEAEFKEFKGETLPQLKRWGTNKPTMEQFKEELTGTATQSVSANVGLAETFDIAKNDLSAFDLLFAFLGIATAFRLGGASASEHEPTAWAPSPAPDNPAAGGPPTPPVSPDGIEPAAPDLGSEPKPPYSG